MVPLLKVCWLVGSLFFMGDALHSIIAGKTGREDVFFRISLAYGLGTGTLCLLMFYLSLCGAKIGFTTIVFVSLPFLVLFLYKKNFHIPVSLPRLSLSTRSFTALFLVCLIILSMAVIVWRALYLPMHLPDDIAQWGLKAKILFYEQTVRADDFFDPNRLMYHAFYPFLVPLLESFFYTAMGAINDTWVKIPFPLFFTALLFFMYGAQKPFSSRHHALLFTCIVALLPVFIRDVHGNPSSGYADVPFTFYYTVAAVLLFTWLHEKTPGNVALAALFITFAVFSKKEGFIVWGILFFTTLLCMRIHTGKEVRHALWFTTVFAGLPAVLLLPWIFFSNTIHVHPWEHEFEIAALSFSSMLPRLSRIPMIASAFFQSLFSPRHYNIFWFMFCAVVIIRFRQTFSRTGLFFVLLIAGNVCALFCAALLFPYGWWTGMLYDIPRLFMINAPLAACFMSYQLALTDKRP